MNARDCFLAAYDCQPTNYTPIWLMRQAGRYLPEYRKLRTHYGFVEMVKTPELAAEVTLQPMRRFDLDAAIIFSDILVIPEALGLPYFFREQGGIGMERVIRTKSCVEQLNTERVTEHLQYVAGALRLVRQELPNKALLGFGGAPWTLAAYMVQGGSDPTFSNFLAWVDQEPGLFESLMERLTEALIAYFKLQIASGVDAIQIFDSWGALCQTENYWHLSLRWIQRIIEALPDSTRIILYAKGMGHCVDLLLKTGARGISLDWTVHLHNIKKSIPGTYALQGNLDPHWMTQDIDTMLQHAKAIMEGMQPYAGHIFNLGHGITPQARIENVEALVHFVKAIRPLAKL